MKKLAMAVGFTASAVFSTTIISFSSVFPTGTTIYQPDKTWSGYTILDATDQQGTVLIDMNGNIVRRLTELKGMGLFRILPGGFVMDGDEMRLPYQESIALKQFDWDGNEVWRFDQLEQVVMQETENEAGETVGGETVWGTRMHHDWQREGDAVGYYSPEAAPLTDRGSTLILGHKNHVNLDVSDKRLEDDYIYEVDWEGEIT